MPRAKQFGEPYFMQQTGGLTRGSHGTRQSIGLGEVDRGIAPELLGKSLKPRPQRIQDSTGGTLHTIR